MLLVCPRCAGSLPPDARACPRCGLLLPVADDDSAAGDPSAATFNGRDTYFQSPPAADEYSPTQPVDFAPAEATGPGTTTPYAAPTPEPHRSPFGLPTRARTRDDSAAATSQAASLLVPRGAVEMLPNESVVFQLGALYLTNKRVILLAPTVLRTAFLRDVDAVGTLTERSSGWTFFLGLALLLVTGAELYFSIARQQYETDFPTLFVLDPRIVAVGAGVLAVYLLVNYFFWVKRTLFVSVGGRPLITVSVTDWNARQLEGMDSFINAYCQLKDATHAGEAVEIERR